MGTISSIADLAGGLASMTASYKASETMQNAATTLGNESAMNSMKNDAQQTATQELVDAAKGAMGVAKDAAQPPQ